MLQNGIVGNARFWIVLAWFCCEIREVFELSKVWITLGYPVYLFVPNSVGLKVSVMAEQRDSRETENDENGIIPKHRYAYMF